MRVNADELRCKVIGEGGNLGFTQRARVEFSQHGGRINTDFIDNSGGVDCSDREVNIKILLSDAAKKKGLTRKKRDELLASMTDDVANLVLRNNYLQTQAISMSETLSVARIDETARLITALERTGLLESRPRVPAARIRDRGSPQPQAGLYATGTRDRIELRENRSLQRPHRIARRLSRISCKSTRSDIFRPYSGAAMPTSFRAIA